MKSLFAAVVLASALTGLTVGGASAFSMNVPKSVIVAAIEAPTVSSAESTFVFPPLTFLSTTAELAERLRSNVIEIIAPGIFAGIGNAYHQAIGAPATSTVPDIVSI